MAEVTIYAAAAGGHVLLWNATLATCWSSATGNDTNTSAESRLGYAMPDIYNVWQVFLSFDTSDENIPSGATINSVTLGLTRKAWGTHGSSGGTLEAYAHDWSDGGMTTADYLTSTEIAALYSDPGRMAYGTIPANNGNIVTITFTSESGFASSLSSGTTYLFLCCQHSRTAPEEATLQDVYIYSGYETGEPTYRPRLVVDYTEPPSWSGLTVIRDVSS